MIKLYMVSSNRPSLKAKKWLIKYHLEFIEINLATHSFSREEFNHLLTLTENGTKELLTTRSQNDLSSKPFLDDLTLEELLFLINQHKVELRKPLIADETHLQPGFNAENIRQFLPKTFRQVEKEMGAPIINE